jgi:hypothetical protein
MKYEDFKYERLIGIDGKPFMRISMDYDDKVFSEDVNIYWFGIVFGRTMAEIRILKRILKYLKYIGK